MINLNELQSFTFVVPNGYKIIGNKLYFENELIAQCDSEFIPNVGIIFYGGYENGEASIDVKHAAALAAFLLTANKVPQW